MRLVWNSTLGCGCLFRLADLDLMFSDRLNQDERTTTRWRNGYPSTTSVCTSIHGPVVRISWCECVVGDLMVCVWGVGGVSGPARYCGSSWGEVLRYELGHTTSMKRRYRR